jgi:pimeloyl-ACP methyl ester carboxylesterase
VNYSLAEGNTKGWKKPVELIYGERSNYFNERQKEIYQRYYPQMKEENFHKIENAGHWVHF